MSSPLQWTRRVAAALLALCLAAATAAAAPSLRMGVPAPWG